MGDARTVFLLEKIGETFGVSPDELRTDMDGLGAEVRPFFEPDGPAKLIRWESQPEIKRIVSGWRFDINADRAEALGLSADNSFEDNIRYYLEDYLSTA